MNAHSNGASYGPTLNGPPPPDMPPSPPHSNARSSTGTRMMSITSNSGGPPSRTYNREAMFRELYEHHRVLKAFLDQSVRDDKEYHPHNRARDKLLRLSSIQFQELSTDVYDELLRREDERASQQSNNGNRNIPRFLLPKPNFHPKRNQARQKLSTLASKKFRELATDVLFELERRFEEEDKKRRGGPRAPSPTGSTTSHSQGGRSRPSTGISINAGPYQARRPSATSPEVPYSPAVFDGERPMAKQLQSSTMVPTKSTMVEDDDDASDAASAYDMSTRYSKRTTGMSGVGRLRDSHFGAEQQAQITSLQSKVSELEDQLKHKDQELASGSRAVEAEKAKASDVLSDLERQVKSAEDLNADLKQELERLKSTNSDLEARLRDHANTGDDVEQLRSRNMDLESLARDHEALQEDHDVLQNDHIELRQAHEQAQTDHEALREKYEAAQDEHRSLMESHMQVLANHDTLRGDHDALQSEHSGLQESHEQVLANHDALREDHEALQNDHSGVRDTHEQVLTNHKALETDHAGLRESHDRALAAQTSLQAEHANLKEALEKAVNDYHGLNNELTSLRTNHEQLQNDHQNLRDAQQNDDAVVECQQRYRELETRYSDREQAMIEARQEISQTMQELKMLSEQHDQAELENEELQKRVSQLQNEVADWKSRYAKTKTSLRSLKATSMALYVDQPDAADSMKDTGFVSANGLVNDVHVTQYQSAVNELLHLARSDDHDSCFNHMRTIVSAVSAVVKDVEKGSCSEPESSIKEYAKLKRQVSKAMNTLVTTSKVFGQSKGLSPVSLVDAAASDLTAAVIALIKVAKIQPSPSQELLDSDDGPP